MTVNPRIVLDASVVVKWFVTEEHSDIALTLPPRFELLAPDFLVIEVANVFLKKVRNQESPIEVLADDIRQLPSYLHLVDSVPLVERAFRIAAEHNRSVYDALYVALALQEGCQLITADQRLCNGLAPYFGETMVWLGDMPDGEPGV